MATAAASERQDAWAWPPGRPMLTHNHGRQEDVAAASFPSGHVARVFSSAPRPGAGSCTAPAGRRGPGRWPSIRYGAQKIYAPVIVRMSSPLRAPVSVCGGRGCLCRLQHRSPLSASRVCDDGACVLARSQESMHGSGHLFITEEYLWSGPSQPMWPCSDVGAYGGAASFSGSGEPWMDAAVATHLLVVCTSLQAKPQDKQARSKLLKATRV